MKRFYTLLGFLLFLVVASLCLFTATGMRRFSVFSIPGQVNEVKTGYRVSVGLFGWCFEK